MFILLLSLAASPAHASSAYPGGLSSDLSTPCTPTCTVCHATNAGGGGTVTQAFGQAMMARGLTGGADLASLQTALDAMAADAVDSDGDGTSDVDALAGGLEPNTGADLCDGDLPDAPTYGCFGGGGSAAAMLGFWMGGRALLRRRVRSDT